MSETKRTTMCLKCGFINSGSQSYCQNCGVNIPKDEIIGEVRRAEKGTSKRGCLLKSAFSTGIAGSVFSTLFGAFLAEWLFYLPLFIVPWVGLVLTWRWPLIGGVILAVAGFLPIVALMNLTRIDPNEALGAALALMFVLPLITLPLVSSGILNIVRWYKGRKH